MLISGIVIFFLCVGSCLFFAVHSNYKAEKIELLKSIRENRWNYDLQSLDYDDRESEQPGQGKTFDFYNAPDDGKKQPRSALGHISKIKPMKGDPDIDEDMAFGGGKNRKRPFSSH